MAYIKIDETNRITAASYDFHCGKGEIEVDIPEDIGFPEIHSYKYVNGEFVYDPLPVTEPEEPVEEPSVWDELDMAYQSGYTEGYQEGVNSAYDE